MKYTFFFLLLTFDPRCSTSTDNCISGLSVVDAGTDIERVWCGCSGLATPRWRHAGSKDEGKPTEVVCQVFFDAFLSVWERRPTRGTAFQRRRWRSPRLRRSALPLHCKSRRHEWQLKPGEWKSVCLLLVWLILDWFSAVQRSCVHHSTVSSA